MDREKPQLIDGAEAERRLRRVSEMRTLVLRLKFAARDAYRRGETNWCPDIDPRSDPEFWQRAVEENKRKFGGDGTLLPGVG